MMCIFISRKEQLKMQKRCKHMHAGNMRYNFFSWCINTEKDTNNFCSFKNKVFFILRKLNFLNKCNIDFLNKWPSLFNFPL